VFVSSDPIHIVVTYDFSEFKIYINGEMGERKDIPSLSFLLIGHIHRCFPAWAFRIKTSSAVI